MQEEGEKGEMLNHELMSFMVLPCQLHGRPRHSWQLCMHVVCGCIVRLLRAHARAFTPISRRMAWPKALGRPKKQPQPLHAQGHRHRRVVRTRPAGKPQDQAGVDEESRAVMICK